MTTGTSESIRVLSNGWAVDTTAPVDLKSSKDNEVSRISNGRKRPPASCLFQDKNALGDLIMCPSLVVFMFYVNSAATLTLVTPYIFTSLSLIKQHSYCGLLKLQSFVIV